MKRRLGVPDAVVIGMGSMIGAGIFAALGPAAGAAGSGLLIALASAAVVAYCNAMSSARLAALYPLSGGTYVYGRERLGEFWGYLAGWAFVVGKTASCAAMALTVGSYLWPGQAHAVAVAAVVALTAVNYAGVQKSAFVTRIIVAVVLAVLAAVVVTCLTSAGADASRLDIGSDATVGGVLQASGLLFFAFAGYARIATLGEEVRDPARTIPRAIPAALGITLAVYALVAVAVLTVLGPDGLAHAAAPLSDAVRAAGAERLVPVVRAGWRGRRARLAPRADPGGLAHHRGDGPGPAPAARPVGRPPALGCSAPRGTRRRSRRLPARRDHRPARGDRLLLLRGAGLLRHRQRLRLHPRPGRGRAPPDRPRPGSGRLHAARLLPAPEQRGLRGRGPRCRRRRPRTAQGARQQVTSVRRTGRPEH